MKFLVCISNVPDTTSKITFTDNNTVFNAAGVQYILNPYDELALARALELADGGKATITIMHVGEIASEPTIRKTLALGADDAVRINARPRDGFYVASQIAAYAADKQFDILFFGRESIDFNGAQVCSMVAELLHIPSVSIAKKLDLDGTVASIDREIEGGKEVIQANLPLAISCSEGISQPKIPNMRGIMAARTKPLQVIEAFAAPDYTSILHYESPAPRGKVQLVESGNAEKLIELLHSQAKVI